MSRLWLIGGGVALAALVAASLAIALSEQVEPLNDGTPERAVQQFLEAMETEDYSAAHDLLSDELQAECELELFATGSVPFERSIGDSRVTLDKTTVLNGTAVVVVRVTRFRTGGPFEASEHTSEQRYSLRKDADGLWRFTASPWPFFGKCGRLAPAPEFSLPHEPTRGPEPAAVPAEERPLRGSEQED